jgi:hypothetical protein
MWQIKIESLQRKISMSDAPQIELLPVKEIH